jgi:hypothetical protein
MANKQETESHPTEEQPKIISLLEGKPSQSAPFNRRPSGVNLRGQVPESALEQNQDREEYLKRQYILLHEERRYLIQKIAELKENEASQALEDEVDRLQEQVGRMRDVVRYMERGRERERMRNTELQVKDGVDVPEMKTERGF